MPIPRSGLAVLLLLLATPAWAAELSVTDAWSRATAADAPGIAYLTIRGGDAPDRLLSASSPAAGKVALHAMTMTGNVMRMRELDGLEVPAGGTVVLAPGAPLHLMLEGLKARLRPGDRVPLVLTFAKAGERRVEAVVGTPGQSSMPAAAPPR